MRKTAEKKSAVVPPEHVQREAKRAGSIVPPEHVQRGVAALINTIGENAALSRLDVNRQTLARLAGGLRVRRATADIVALRLASADGPRVA